jgi:hypothetical protein
MGAPNGTRVYIHTELRITLGVVPRRSSKITPTLLWLAGARAAAPPPPRRRRRARARRRMHGAPRVVPRTMVLPFREDFPLLPWRPRWPRTRTQALTTLEVEAVVPCVRPRDEGGRR